MNGEPSPALDPRLAEILRCPACHAEFASLAEPQLRCTGCALSFPVRDGIPILLVDEATKPGA